MILLHYYSSSMVCDFFPKFGLMRNHHIKNALRFEENSTLPLPERLEASGVESVCGEVSQESPNKSVQIGKQTACSRGLGRAW